MALTSRNKAKLRQFKEDHFPPLLIFTLRVMKEVLEDDFKKFDYQAKSLTSARYKYGSTAFAVAQVEMTQYRNAVLATLNKLDKYV